MLAKASELRVLIVEDDPLVMEMICGIVDDIGYSILGEAMDGQEAIEKTKTLKPDLVLMDVEMPRLNGIEAARIIYNECPTPVIILTAYDSFDLVNQAGDAGVGAYLLKPPNTQELKRAVTIALARFDDFIALQQLNNQLQKTLAQVKTLTGLLPICANCKKIRNDQGYWQQLEVYIQQHIDVKFSHGICPNCMEDIYSDFVEDS